MSMVDEKDLANELKNLGEKYRKLKDDALFVMWFLCAYVTDTEEESVEALTGDSGDKNADAILIEDKQKTITIVQGKYRKGIGRGNEVRNDLIAFSDLAEDLLDEGRYAALKEQMAPDVARRLSETRKKLNNGYRLNLYFVTTGKVSDRLRNEAKHRARVSGFECSFQVFDGESVLVLLQDYLDGVAPPVPSLDLEIESGRGIELKGILNRFDHDTEIESWVFPVKGQHIADMFDRAGPRLFARNVRGFLGETAINRNMENTLRKEPNFFWYYNNGITIICDQAEKVSRAGREILEVVNPQIINGQQTARTLHRASAQDRRATVLVRVISVPRKHGIGTKHYERLVSQIVGATNWQNAIKASDLMANDRRQIQIERNLRKIDYQYLRKRQSKGEARENGAKHRFLIKKDELAQAVGACELDPSIVRDGKEGLFEERYYGQVFPNESSMFYLSRFWLVNHVARAAKGYPERAYAKWLVTHFLWSKIGQIIGANQSQFEAFRKASEKRALKELEKLAGIVFRAAKVFFNLNRGTGEKATDVSSFFKKRHRHEAFELFWRGSRNKFRASASRAEKRFKKELHKFNK